MSSVDVMIKKNLSVSVRQKKSECPMKEEKIFKVWRREKNVSIKFQVFGKKMRRKKEVSDGKKNQSVLRKKMNYVEKRNLRRKCFLG